MLEIISFKICPFVQRVTALLEAKNIPYKVKYIDLKNKPDWFLKLSPTGQVPVMITKDTTVLFESDAIIEYIDDVSDPLENVSPEKRAEIRAWSYQAAKNYLLQCSTMRSSNKEKFSENIGKLHSVFERIEKQLNHTKFFGSDTLGNVDIAWLPLLHRAYIIQKHSGYDMLEPFSKIKAWQKSIMETGIVENTVSEDFEEKFTNFYLSEKTYLGRGRKDFDTQENRKTSKSCC